MKNFLASALAAILLSVSAQAAPLLDVCDEYADGRPATTAQLNKFQNGFMPRAMANDYKRPIDTLTFTSLEDFTRWARHMAPEVRRPAEEMLKNGSWVDVRYFAKYSKPHAAYLYSQAEESAAEHCQKLRAAMPQLKGGELDAWLDAYGDLQAARLYMSTLSLPKPNPFAALRPKWDYTLETSVIIR